MNSSMTGGRMLAERRTTVFERDESTMSYGDTTARRNEANGHERDRFRAPRRNEANGYDGARPVMRRNEANDEEGGSVATIDGFERPDVAGCAARGWHCVRSNRRREPATID